MKSLAGVLLGLLLTWSGAAHALCPRPTGAGGYNGIAYGDVAAQVLDGPRVRVHYTVEGPHALGDLTDADGAPRGARVVLDEAERALDAFAGLGFAPPPGDVGDGCDGDGDARYDIYLVNFTAGDGQTVPESCRGGSCSSFALAARDLSRRYGSSQRGAQTVVVHELFHAVQFGITAELPAFWSEGTAQWAADQVNPALTDLESFLPTFFEAPERPLDSQGAGAVGAWQYATAIWPVFLHEQGGWVTPIFEALRDEEDFDVAADRALADRGSSLADAFARFGVWNAATGARAAGDGYAAARSYPEVPIEALAGDELALVMTGLSTRYVDLQLGERSQVELAEFDATRTRLHALPFNAEGTLSVARAAQLEAGGPLDAGHYVLVVSSTTSSKRDNRVTLRFSPAPSEPPATRTEPPSSSCSIQGSPTPMTKFSVAPLLFLALGLFACSRKAGSEEKPAETSKELRIVSVGSANTETVYALGKGAAVVAVDTSSLYPEEATKLPKVGYQRALSAEGILSVKPTLVLLPAEGGPPDVLGQLKSAGLALETFDPPGTEEGTLQRIEGIAKLIGADAAPLVGKVKSEIEAAKAEAAKTPSEPKVLVLYARGPGTVQAFGQNTPADRLLGLAHAKNAAQGFEGNRPITAEAVVSWAPDWIVLPARGLESLGGKDGVLQQPGLRETPAGKAGQVVGVDDLLLLGFGPRLGEAVRTLSRAVHGAP